MKTKFKLTEAYLANLPAEYLDGLDEEIKQADSEPYIRRAGYAGLSIEDDDERTCIARMSTRDMDSDNEIIMPYSLSLERYQRNPIVCVNHRTRDLPIGSASAVRMDDRGISGKMTFGDTQMANDVWSLVRDRHMRANSIGFIVLSYVARSHPDFGGLVDKYLAEWDEFTIQQADRLKGFIRRGVLLENSVVTLPANPNALMQAVSERSITLSDDMIKCLGIDLKSVGEEPDGEQAEEEAQPENNNIDVILDGEVVATIDPEEDLESVEIVTVPEDEDEDTQDGTETVEQPKLVARLVSRPEPKMMDPKMIAKMAQDALDLMRGRV